MEIYELYKHLEVVDEEIYDYFLESQDEDDEEEDFKNTDGFVDSPFTKQYQAQKKERLRKKIIRNQKAVLAMLRRNSRLKSKVDQLYYTLQTVKKKNHDLMVELTKMFKDQFHRNTADLVVEAMNVLATPSRREANRPKRRFVKPYLL